MTSPNKKQIKKTEDALATALFAKARKAALAKEVLPENAARDPGAVQRLFRRRRRRAKWNAPNRRKRGRREQ